jgi:hypothetical protein
LGEKGNIAEVAAAPGTSGIVHRVSEETVGFASDTASAVRGAAVGAAAGAIVGAAADEVRERRGDSGADAQPGSVDGEPTLP